jgi:hypothetical protein
MSSVTRSRLVGPVRGLVRLRDRGRPRRIHGRGVQGDVDRNDGGRQVRTPIVAVEVARGRVLDLPGAPAGSAWWQQGAQDGAADDSKEVKLVGGENPIGDDELVPGGLQSGSEAGPVGVDVWS